MTEIMRDMNSMPVAARPQQDALVAAVSQREIAEAQNRIILAKRFPRDETMATEKIKIACQRPALAEGAIYTYPRGGTNVQGPSIRLAEAIAQSWGNLDTGVREIEQRFGESTIETFAWDLETNVRITKTFQVKHIRRTGSRNVDLEDPRDIYEMVANQAARRQRACILAVVPGDVVEMAVRECEQTLNARADTSTAGIKKMIDGFEGFGVTREQLEKRLGRNLEGISAAQMIGLGKIYNSLKDGMSTPATWFHQAEIEAQEASDEGTGGVARVKSALRQQASATGEAETEGWTPPAETAPAARTETVSNPDLCPFHKVPWTHITKKRDGSPCDFWSCSSGKGTPNKDGRNDKGYCKQKPPDGYDGPGSQESAPQSPAEETEATPAHPETEAPQAEAPAAQDDGSEGLFPAEADVPTSDGVPQVEDHYAAMSDADLAQEFSTALRLHFGERGADAWVFVEEVFGRPIPKGERMPVTLVKNNREQAIEVIRKIAQAE